MIAKLKVALKNWLAEWPETHWLLILAALLIPLSGWAVFALTGYRPQEGMEWLVGLAARSFQIVLALAWTTIIYRFTFKDWPDATDPWQVTLGKMAIVLGVFALVLHKLTS